MKIEDEYNSIVRKANLIASKYSTPREIAESESVSIERTIALQLKNGKQITESGIQILVTEITKRLKTE